jgi:ABC-type transport system involved in multi-copper enzyme maturation permease subunit
MSKTFAGTGIWKMLAIGLTLLVVGVGVFGAMTDFGTEGVFFVLLYVVPALFLLVIATVVTGASAVSLTSERELGNLDFLRGTHLSAAQVIWGKFGAAAITGAKLTLLGALLSGCIAALRMGHRPLSPENAIHVPLALVAAGSAVSVLCVASGLLAAAFAKTNAAGVITSYVVAALILLLVPSVIESVSSTPHWTSIACSLSPPFAFLDFMQGLYEPSGHENSAQTLIVSVGTSLGLTGLEMFLAVIVFRLRWSRED